jgi:hypothetical protein
VLATPVPARRVVHFTPDSVDNATTPLATGVGGTLRHRQGHQYDPDDPFIDSRGNAGAVGSRIVFSSNIQVCSLLFLNLITDSYSFRIHLLMKISTSIKIYPPPHHRTGDQGLTMCHCLPHPAINSSPRRLKHLCQREIERHKELLISCHSLRLTMTIRRGVNSACELLFFLKFLQRIKRV